MVLTLPLLEGTDGVQKMSKSLGNAIGIAEPPAEIFGKIMSISDAMMVRYYELLTSEELGALRQQIESGALHPMDAKKRLARAIVARFYDDATAQREVENFERRFQRRELPDDVTEFVYVSPPARVLVAAAADEVGADEIQQRGAQKDRGRRGARRRCSESLIWISAWRQLKRRRLWCRSGGARFGA